ncbi:DNA mismatch repair protein Msh1, putative [Talaromyces stipitatus ATCC 10500]|uniref:DNA mismatch repair protein MSH3 n=1 Tax=Talaromyces stipitatus (strain ATCC 10500 / CBS 375.48 / QM 6759 / NRRL 1006) TaxID=441959 RepID=B8MF67_TALSN|nr:DNA mismatch repair protein Msh1, putative [Talaromyces stipitatus ATCC 10500]EED16166.1 DNA mismatch repair protein Msh1, putative [Talaromyces stipitatus ATCC 10500]
MQARASCGRGIIATCLRSIPSRDVVGQRAISAFACQHTFRASTLRIAVCFARGAKTKATAKLKDLPQGALKLETYSDGADDVPRYPTVVQGHRNNMEKFKNCVVLTRVGGFYELYFEQAEELAPLLNIKLASKKTNAGPVPMAGFPFFQLDRFLKILVQDLNRYVAVSEEFMNPVEEKSKSGGLLFDRKVTRVITPGTLIDEKFIDTSQNNFLLSLYIDTQYYEDQQQGGSSSPITHLLSSSSGRVGLAWMDLSTGDFYTQVTTTQMLPSAIARIGAREIVADQRLQNLMGQELQMLVGIDHQLLTLFHAPTTTQPMSEWAHMLEASVRPEIASTFTNEEVAAGFNLLEYVRVQLQGVGMKLQPPRRRHLDESMGIDRNSLRGLEILETARDGLGKGSLLHAVRRTATKSGARLLRDRLTSPSTSLSVIQERLDLVTYFLQDEETRETIVSLLKRSYDSQRLVQKFTLGRGDPDDLICLSRAIEASREVYRVLSDRRNNSTCRIDATRQSLEALIRRLRLDGPVQLAEKILAAIDEEGLLQKHRIEDSQAAEVAGLAQDIVLSEALPEEAESMPRKIRFKTTGRPGIAVESDRGDIDTWIMRRNASDALRRLHERLDELKEEKQALTTRLQEQVGSSMLTLKWTPGLGYICHVKGAKISQQALEDLGVTRNVSSTKSTRSFYLPAWSQLGARLDQSKVHIRAEEQRIFEDLRRDVILNLVKIRRNAAVMDELDVACSFTMLAKEQNMVRPILNTTTSHHIVGGRHPTVKLGLEEQGRRFVSNDCFIGDEERIWLITGPNMGGKSTFLRQNALITILAQVGSFVPAEYAEIGIVDQIFSRVGAADDLFRDQSTFMVEMLETAAILKQATPRSFVIMDEVGRGTTPEDGTAVGYACLEHLYNVNQCRTLFATHFHILVDMTASFEKLGAYCTDIKENPSGSFSFVHKLRKGVNRQSHALKVARLAGLPESAITVAERVLCQMGASNPTSQADWSKHRDESKAASSG